METVDQIIAEMREWANGEGCFNDDPEGEPLPCVYWAQQPFLAMCDRLEAAAKRGVEAGLAGASVVIDFPKGIVTARGDSIFVRVDVARLGQQAHAKP